MSSADRLQQFQELLADYAALAFFPISSDLQYLTAVPRDVPNYGHNIHPGDWLEGVWITPQHAPVLPLPRMTAEFGGLSRLDNIDIRVGGIYRGWCYDFGRTVFFGEPNAEAIRVHELVMASQAAGIAALKAGQATTSDVDAAARQVIEEAGYGATFRHRLGHGIGMDVHEPPFLTQGDETPLQEGMLFTIEPSIMQFNDYSARVEDVVVARAAGGEKLTDGWQELIVIE